MAGMSPTGPCKSALPMLRMHRYRLTAAAASALCDPQCTVSACILHAQALCPSL